MKGNLYFVLSVLSAAVLTNRVAASPAPAPAPVSPAYAAFNVNPSPTLTWRWVDELVVNGSFETGLTPGWYTGGPNPEMWQILTLTSNVYRMGYRFATIEAPRFPQPAKCLLMQEVYIPSDAISATLKWKYRFYSQTRLYTYFRFYLTQSDTVAAGLSYETGFFGPPPYDWIARSTNLLAFAGQSIQLVLEAETTAPIPGGLFSWDVDLDGFSLECEHSATPEFQVYLSKNSSVGPANMVGSTQALTFVPPPLEPQTTYYWRVGAVRDGVTNVSSVMRFTTGQRILPQLTVAAVTSTRIFLRFSTEANRTYAIEQAETLDGTTGWHDLLWVGPGNGAQMQVEVPVPWSEAAFWRLRGD